ncbi:MAG: biotin synthase BioB [Nitrospirae bacterium]|nr:MAG: biotin synthase BioB [Nitrospirota bacterium]
MESGRSLPPASLPSLTPSHPSVFHELADRILNGESALMREEALMILRTSEEHLLDLVSAAFRIRHRFFGKTVTLQMLLNAKSGACQEDCHYCSQSSISRAPIARYGLLSPDAMIEGARRAAAANARRFCIVISGRGPLDHEIANIARAVRRIKSEIPIHICCSLGLLTLEQAQQLKAAGVDRINHNLNTSEAYHPAICTTHTYHDRLTTLRHARSAGLELCSGGIVGMGEQDEDLVDLAFALREIEPDSIPVNMLHPIPGTPLEHCHTLTPSRCVKILALFRFVHPARELRIAGGREFNLRSLQPLAIYIADSLFVDGYLTTPGQSPHEVAQLITDLGFEVKRDIPSPPDPTQCP